ncbi:MAG TPA: FHA domain-containing protein [Lysobacter sp.]|nr:FHA domain-containing protein [Lysobacter sp.]
METYRLRLQKPDAAEYELGPGVHALGIDRTGLPTLVDDSREAVARISIDRRGVWLRVRDDVRGLHVNGRPVRRVAHLRAGDCLYVEGEGLTLLGRRPDSPPRSARRVRGAGALLRSVGGEHHGRCFAVEPAVDVPAWPESDVRLHPDEAGVVLEAERPDGVQVNGHAVQRALLRAGDQLVVAGRRYVVEGHGGEDAGSAEPPAPAHQPDAARRTSSGLGRLPWLLLAALLMAGALSGLLLYGAR